MLVAGCTKSATDETPAATQRADAPATKESAPSANASANATSDASGANATPTNTTPANRAPPSNATPPTIPVFNATNGTALIATVNHTSKTFDIVFTMLPQAGTLPVVPSENCVKISGGNVTVLLSGKLVATWSSATPLDTAFSVTEHTFANGTSSASGTSPLTLALRGSLVPPAIPAKVTGVAMPTLDVALGLAAQPSVAVQEKVHLAVTLDFLGPEPKLVTATC